MTTVWKPQKKQAIFLARPEYEALYGGAAGDEAERPLWGMKRGGGRLAKGSISTGREIGDHFATWRRHFFSLPLPLSGVAHFAKARASTGREIGDQFATWEEVAAP